MANKPQAQASSSIGTAAAAGAQVSTSLGGRASTGGQKSRTGKTVNIGGNRTVTYYRLTDHELDFIGDPQKEAAQARALASFCLGLLVTTVSSFSFSEPASQIIKGVWIAVGALSSLAMIYYFIRGFILTKRATSRLAAIKEQHDFDAQ
ncbi:hypothetical protein [Sphingomonas sp.]|uniref:hypothetical protein n=1 Tax=Sphingomonas sp. TaxID=28214 RepID=UPI0035BC0DF8